MYFDDISEFITNPLKDDNVSYYRICINFNLPIDSTWIDNNEYEYDVLELKENDILAIGSSVLNFGKIYGIKRVNVIKYKGHNQTWSQKYHVVGLSSDFISLNTNIFEFISPQVKRRNESSTF